MLNYWILMSYRFNLLVLLNLKVSQTHETQILLKYTSYKGYKKIDHWMNL